MLVPASKYTVRCLCWQYIDFGNGRLLLAPDEIIAKKAEAFWGGNQLVLEVEDINTRTFESMEEVEVKLLYLKNCRCD